jgi:anthranilate phosphoribosyltransferase
VGIEPNLSAAELAGGEPKDNAAVIERVLRGRGPKAAEAAVVLNAGGALYVGGKAATFGAGVALARSALREGRGWDALGRLRAASVARR